MSITELVSSIRLKDSITFTLNSQFLNQNFQVVKQCLLRIQQLQGNLGKSKQSAGVMQERIKSLEDRVKLNTDCINTNQMKVKELSANVGDDFMKKMYGIEEKTKNMYDFDQTVRRLQLLNKFVVVGQFQDKNKEVQQQFARVWKLKEDFDRYLLNSNFDKYKSQQERALQQKHQLINQCNQEISKIRQQMSNVLQRVSNVNKQLEQNNAMIKQINFTELLQKMKKFREETDAKVQELAIKMKKKVSQSELLTLQKAMIQKLDKFFNENGHSKAEKQETKDALVFLQKKINDMEDILLQKVAEEDKDALFSSKKWQCASCTKDLGKFEGKMGQFKPWSVFPCKQLDPEKTGGFGYLNYIDKMAYKKGYDIQQPGMERLNKTFFQNRDKDTPSKRLGTTRGSNLISNYGSEDKSSSLKEVYFKQLQSERGSSNHRIFRVTKKQPAKLPESEVKNQQN